MDLRVLSIGTLSYNTHWGEDRPVRTGHATSVLVRSGDRVIVVDPGLPPKAIAARLHERAGLRPDDVTQVFLTSFHPEHRAGIEAFPNADWLIHGTEREALGVPLATALKKAAESSEADPDLLERAQREIAVLRRCKPAPDKLAESVDLFPLPGVTPGLCGLLCTSPRSTTLICGDAIPTADHLDRGTLLKPCADREAAEESFKEAVEIADLLVLGRDNIVVNPTRRPF